MRPFVPKIKAFVEDHTFRTTEATITVSGGGFTGLCKIVLFPDPIANVASQSFEAIANIVKVVHDLGLPGDKHGRDNTLSSYLQYVFNAPQGQHPAGRLGYTCVCVCVCVCVRVCMCPQRY